MSLYCGKVKTGVSSKSRKSKINFSGALWKFFLPSAGFVPRTSSTPTSTLDCLIVAVPPLLYLCLICYIFQIFQIFHFYIVNVMIFFLLHLSKKGQFCETKLLLILCRQFRALWFNCLSLLVFVTKLKCF